MSFDSCFSLHSLTFVNFLDVDLKQKVVEFLPNKFKAHLGFSTEYLFHVQGLVVSKADNTLLSTVPTDAEIKKTIFSLKKTAP